MARQSPKKTHTDARPSTTDICSGWYERYAREVWAMAYARCLDKDTAYDLTQECFLRAWQHLEHHHHLEHPRAWLLRVIRNLALDTVQSAFRRHGTQPSEQLFRLNGGTSQPLEQLIDEEQREQVRAMLAELEPSDRELLTMRYALDYDATQIAEALEAPLSAIHMRLSRARKRLAEKLTALGARKL